MAEGKKTFIFYSDWINMVREMPDEDAGGLLKHILKYVNDENPTTENLLIKMAFGHIKPMLKKDLEKWDSIREKRKEAGKKGGRSGSGKYIQDKGTGIDGEKFYVLYCYNDKEEFIKIGVTYDSVYRRFSGKIPYNFKILMEHFSKNSLKLETNIESSIKEYKYAPKKIFGGKTECYSLDCLQSINNQLLKDIGQIISSQSIAKHRKAVNDNDNVNVNDNENKETPFSFRKGLYALGIEKNLVDDFLKNRRLKKLANTETAFKNLVNEFEKNGTEINGLMNMIVSNGWGSFKNSWEIRKEKSSAKKEKRDASDIILERNGLSKAR